MSHSDFRIAVDRGIIASVERINGPTCQPVINNCPTRLIGHNHFPEPASGKPDYISIDTSKPLYYLATSKFFAILIIDSGPLCCLTTSQPKKTANQDFIFKSLVKSLHD